MPKKVGRPRKEIDYSLIEELAKIQCTDYEIAACIRMTKEGFCKRKQRDAYLVNVLARGREAGKSSLRRLQWKTAHAVDKYGEPSSVAGHMQVWLGKQHLGQRDKSEVQQREVVALTDMTDDELRVLVDEQTGSVVDLPEESSDPGRTEGGRV